MHKDNSNCKKIKEKSLFYFVIFAILIRSSKTKRRIS